ncbi:hypothetical protein ACFBZI_02130 [Moraxella sp. ZJ142]
MSFIKLTKIHTQDTAPPSKTLGKCSQLYIIDSLTKSVRRWEIFVKFRAN